MRKEILKKQAAHSLPPPSLTSLPESQSQEENSDQNPFEFQSPDSFQEEEDQKLPTWSDYFHESFQIEISDEENTPDSEKIGGVFQAYDYGDKLNAKTWFVFLHGGGYSALTWAPMVRHLPRDMFCVAFDFPGHGQTQALNEENLSRDRLVQNTKDIILAILPQDTKLVLVGHSLGGAIAVRTAAQAEIRSRLSGLVVIDVVEGTAVNSLPHMLAVLAKRPSSFSSLSAAIEWAVRTNTVRNEESAKISIPSQLSKDHFRYKWRTNLVATQPFWKDWFEGLSDLFLSIRGPKELVLAGTDRLDTALTIGQMQGKFKLTLLSSVGHVIQEDAPTTFAETIIKFRNLFRV